VSNFLNWRAKDELPTQAVGNDFDEFVLWIASRNKSRRVVGVHLDVMNDRDLFIEIAGVIFNLHVTRAGAQLRLIEGTMNKDGTFNLGRS
jgi:hypothetical protein